MREEKSNSVEDSRNFGYENDRACPDIAHYNYTLRFRSCGLSRGAGFAPSHLWLCPKNPVGDSQPPTPLTKE